MSQGTRNASPESIQSAHEVALAAVARGWRPLPITADGKKVPLVKFTSENGVNLAASSPADVYTLWLEEYRGAGVAVVTGPVEHEGSGLLVIDVDVKDGAQGLESLSAAFAELGALPPTMVVRSPSGGFHYVYRYPAGAGDTYRNWNGWRPGIDVRGWHGIAAIPGSSDVRGTYTLEPGHPSEPAELASSAWLAALVKPAADLALREEFQGRSLESDSPELRRQRIIAAQEIEILCGQLATPGPGKHGRLIFCATAAGSWAHLLGDREAVEPWLQGRLLEALRAAHTARGGHLDERKSARDVAQLVHNGMVNPKWAPAVPVTLLGNLADYGLELAERPSRPPVMPARPWDDIGNAWRLADHYGERVRWAIDAGQWLAYEDERGVWKVEGADVLVQRYAQATLDALPECEWETYDTTPGETAAGKPAPSQRELFAEFVKKSRSGNKVASMTSQARSLAALEVRMADLDADPMLLNVANGVLDLRTGELHPHGPELGLSQHAPVRWQADETAPLWEKFLAEVQPDLQVREYLQRVIGYTMTGSTAEQKLWVHHGSGANGKSVFMDVLARVLGTYAQAIPRSTLVAKTGDAGVPNDVARIRGKRLLRASETAAGRKLDGELVKELTGGEEVSARHMRAEFFDFRPIGKVHLTTNHFPQLGADDAIRRRLATVPWAVVVPSEARDGELSLKLGLEASGILRWAVEGCLGWQRYGLATPDSVRISTEAHLGYADPLGDWMRTRLDKVPGASCELKVLYADYRRHAEEHGERPMVARSLSEALTERGYSSTIEGRNKLRVFRDVTLRLTAFQEQASRIGNGA